MALKGAWPGALLAANGLLILLGTGMALGGRLGPRDTVQAGHMSAHRSGSMGAMDMSGGRSVGPEGNSMGLMYMPSLGPRRKATDPRQTPAHPGQQAPIRVDALVGPRTAAQTRTFTLTATPARVLLAKGTPVDAWTYNGKAPGPVLRVRQGDLVVVHLVNRLPVPTTIHWHGILVPGGEDGVAGLTQDAVPPGHTYTYRFVATEPGTYWYHAHQDSLTQVQRGLFGAVVVDPREAARDTIDRVVTLHTWAVGGRDVLAADDSASVLHIPARPRATVRLRLVNTDSTIHVGTLAGAPFTVAALDGHDLNGPTPLRGAALPIGAGQRYDIRFQMPASGAVALRIADVADDQRGLVDPRLAVVVGAGAIPAQLAKPPYFDMTRYGKPAATRLATYERPGPSYTLRLGAKGGFSLTHPGLTFTINGKTAPNIAPIMVKQGQVIHLRIINDTTVVHPMHLHGHAFAVLKRNGHALAGSPVRLDTLDVFPDETYDVAFIANNPGVWMLHCHNLVHARQGMGLMVMYDGVVTPFKEDGPAGNISD